MYNFNNSKPTPGSTDETRAIRSLPTKNISKVKFPVGLGTPPRNGKGRKASMMRQDTAIFNLADSLTPTGSGSFRRRNLSNKVNHSQTNEMRVDLISKYYFSSSGAKTLEQCTIKHVRDENITDHILVIGDIHGIHNFLFPLRARYLGKIRPVVAFHSTPPDATEWQSHVSQFTNVWFVQGNSSSLVDLKRAGANLARNIIIIVDKTNTTLWRAPYLVDAASVLTVYNCNILAPTMCTIITELVHCTNVKFFTNPLLTGGAASSFKVMIKIGHSRSKQVINSVKRKSHSFRAILRSSESQVDTTHTAKKDMHSSPFFAAGLVFSSSMFETLLGQSFYNPKILHIIEQLVTGSDTISYRDTHSSRVTQITAPAQFIVSFHDRVNVSQLFDFLILNFHYRTNHF